MASGDSSAPASASLRSASPFQWPRDISPAERKSLIAGGLGWMLDAMDVMLYSFVLAYLMTEFGMSKSTGGLLNSLTLIASAIGGLFFGVLADRVGRTRALMASILVYSISSAACGFTTGSPNRNCGKTGRKKKTPGCLASFYKGMSFEMGSWPPP